MPTHKERLELALDKWYNAADKIFSDSGISVANKNTFGVLSDSITTDILAAISLISSIEP